MIRTKRLYFSCLLLSALFLSSGLVWAGRWLWGLAAFLPGLLLSLNTRRQKPPFPVQTASMLALAYLISSIGLAAAGLMLQAPPLLMLVGASASLAAWDLLLLKSGLPIEHSPESFFLESRHLAALALAIGLGILLAAVGRSLRLQLSLIPVLVLVGVIAFSLNQVIKRLASVYN